MGRWWPSRKRPQSRIDFERFTNGAQRVIVETEFSAKRRRGTWVDSSDLLVGLLLAPTDEPGGVVLREAGLSADSLLPAAPGYEDASWEDFSGIRIPFAGDIKEALEASHEVSVLAGHEVIAPLHLLLGALDAPVNAGRKLLLARGANPDRLAADARALLALPLFPGPGAPRS